MKEQLKAESEVDWSNGDNGEAVGKSAALAMVEELEAMVRDKLKEIRDWQNNVLPARTDLSTNQWVKEFDDGQDQIDILRWVLGDEDESTG